MAAENSFDRDEEINSDEESEIKDEDTCSLEEIEKHFSTPYNISSQQAISLKKAYVLSLSHDKSFDKIAAGASNGIVKIFDIDSGRLIKSLHDSEICSDSSNVCEVKFMQTSNNLLLVGTAAGNIDLYDLRTLEKTQSYEEKNDGDSKKPITCFDINANDRVLCAGTEQVGNDAFLMFFDLRQKNAIGGYWLSHEDDITAVKFHPSNSDLLISGSSDGLINIYDVSQETEEDALQMVVNVEDGVQKLNWHTGVSEKEIISCITDMNDLKICDTNGDILSEFSRADITGSLKRKSVENCVLINCHNSNNGSMFLVAGSNFSKGEMLRSLTVNNKNLIPRDRFVSNKQIVRESIFSPQKDILVTSGESGLITLWTREGSGMNVVTSSDLKHSKKESLHSRKPYQRQ